VAVYPVTTDSCAVQVASGVNLFTVHVREESPVYDCIADGVIVPLEHVSVTERPVVGLLGTKSFVTVTVAEFSVLVILQETLARCVSVGEVQVHAEGPAGSPAAV
jgi:hypothetical protein